MENHDPHDFETRGGHVNIFVVYGVKTAYAVTNALGAVRAQQRWSEQTLGLEEKCSSPNKCLLKEQILLREPEVSTHIIAVRARSLYYVVIRTFRRYLAEPYAIDIFVNQK